MTAAFVIVALVIFYLVASVAMPPRLQQPPINEKCERLKKLRLKFSK
jgi:hypothetical protein